MDKQDRIIISIYIIWAVVVFSVTFITKGFDPDNITHFLIIIFFLAQLALFPLIKVISKMFTPKLIFITLAVIFAALVEGFYMLTNPVFKSLKFTAGMSFEKMLSNYLVDLIFTIPVYIVVFFVIWYFINRYDYKLWEYLIFISLGHAIGDGFFFFLASPIMIIFIPYVMINYHAMNLVPFLLVNNKLKPKNKSWMKYVLPPIAIIILYLLSGMIINTVGQLFALSFK
ncbi:MAG: hypothetical protein ABII01_05205 [Candidatus Woesearchaeota archaeon]